MKIGIDISQVVYGGGVSSYTKNLVSSLLSIDNENDYILFGGGFRRMGELKSFLAQLRGKFEANLFPLPPSLTDAIWNHLHILPIEHFTGKIDVFHSSDWSQPPSKAFKVTTIHDLVPLMFPDLSHPRLVAAHKRRLGHVKSQVDKVIVPSEATKHDVINWGMRKDAVVVIPEAPDPIFKPAKAQEVVKLKRRYSLRGRYLLALGVNPRKNTERIIQAYEKMNGGKDLILAVLGVPYMKLDLPRGVRLMGQISPEEVPIFYSGAEALVYPSLYEGFGLPILEAFKCKVPVVTSNLGSMKEICENAGVLVDPYNIDSIIEGMKTAIRTRKTLVKQGLKRVGEFSWRVTAEKTLRLYKEGSKHANRG